jgi:hypothetical protein
MLSGEQLVAFLVAVSFAAGLNLYATVATLGLLGRFGYVALPPGLTLLDDPWVIGVSAALCAIEFVADKLPVVDLLWNGLQTFVRIPAAALMTYAATAQLAPQWQLAAAVAGGAIALAAHSGKAAARVAATTSPEPFSNVMLSAAEDAFAIVVTWFATQYPFIAAAIVLTALVVIALLLRFVLRALRRLFRPSPDVVPGR